jgi:hypothetical protein
MKQDFCNDIFQPSSFPSSHFAIEDAAGKHVPCPSLSLSQKQFLEFKGIFYTLRRNSTSQYFNPPLGSCQSSYRSCSSLLRP